MSISDFFLDDLLYPLVQFFLIGFCFWALVKERLMLRERSSGGMKVSVIRGEHSMAKFYGAYGIISGVLVALALTVESAGNYRTLAVFFNVFVSAYLCLINSWFRSKLLAGVSWLTIREKQ